MKFFPKLQKAYFEERLNRFVIQCNLNSKSVKVFLPNSGRLQELLIPDLPYLIYPADNMPTLKYRVAGCILENRAIMLDTHKSNHIARTLLESNRIPGLENVKVIKAEVTHNNNRFDFLLEQDKELIYTEVKSCTLFHHNLAMFPDAVTERGTRHVRELIELVKQGYKCAVIFLLHTKDIEFFLPDFHTDPDFTNALIESRPFLQIYPVTVPWDTDLQLVKKPEICSVPWDILESENQDSGAYILLMEMKTTQKISIGVKKETVFKPGYYLYIGSALKNLKSRIARHKRKTKNLHWHIDYLLEKAKLITAYPIRTSSDLECEITRKFQNHGIDSLIGFGCTDCTCISHLFWYANDPRKDQKFQKLLLHFRMEKLLSKMEINQTVL